MSDDTQIAKIGNNLPQPGRPQQPIQANLNQYGNDSTQIAYDADAVRCPHTALWQSVSDFHLRQEQGYRVW